MPGYVPPTPLTPRRYLAYMAAFSRWTSIKQLYEFLCSRLRIRYEDMRLWKYTDEVSFILVGDTAEKLLNFWWFKKYCNALKPHYSKLLYNKLLVIMNLRRLPRILVQSIH